MSSAPHAVRQLPPLRPRPLRGRGEGGRGAFREGGGAREDRLRHRWRLLEIAEKTGRTVEEVRLRFGLEHPS